MIAGESHCAKHASNKAQLRKHSFTELTVIFTIAGKPNWWPRGINRLVGIQAKVQILYIKDHELKGLLVSNKLLCFFPDTHQMATYLVVKKKYILCWLQHFQPFNK